MKSKEAISKAATLEKKKSLTLRRGTKDEVT